MMISNSGLLFWATLYIQASVFVFATPNGGTIYKPKKLS